MEENKIFNQNTEEIPSEPEVTTQEWFSDDYEVEIKNSVPSQHSLAVYSPKQKRKKRFFKGPVFAAIVSSLVTCCLCFGIFAVCYRPAAIKGNKLAKESTLPQATLPGSDISQMVAGGSDASFGIPEIYDIVSPAVVTILCQSQSGGYVQSQLSSGSGIILRQDGYIVTNNHVVEGASKVTVNTIAGQSFDANIIGTDARTDLAVLKVKSDTALPYAVLGDSSTLRVGEMALAIGNPLREELAGTLTVGYISAINRSMEIDGKKMTMIQTDAAINPGNSGGALVNMKGQVIGINTAKSTGYDVEGLGFAIPANEAKPIIESIIEHGYVTGRVVIGISGLTVTDAIAKANNLPIGVYVQEVVAGSAAEKAGVKAGDVIIACDDQKITTIDEVNKIRDTHSVNEMMTMQVVRNGQAVNITLVLQEEKPSAKPEVTQPQEPSPAPYSQQIPFPFSWFGW